MFRKSPLAVLMLVCTFATFVSAPTSRAIAARLWVQDLHTVNDLQRLIPDPVCNLMLSGEIMVGDAERIEAKLRELKKSPLLQAIRTPAICLSGPGGDLREAIRISKLFENWTRIVPKDAECVSACAVLFMLGAPQEIGSVFVGSAGRFLHYSARLGFHSPRLELPKETYSRQEVIDIYDRALASFRDIAFWGRLDAETLALVTQILGSPRAGEDERIASARKYFTFVDGGSSRHLPADLLLGMMATPPGQTYYLRFVHEAQNWGIQVFGFAPPRRITFELLSLACLQAAAVRCLRGGKHNRCIEGDIAAHGLPKTIDEELQYLGPQAAAIVLSADASKPGQFVDKQEGYCARWHDLGGDNNVFELRKQEEPFCEVRVERTHARITYLGIDTFNGIMSRENPPELLTRHFEQSGDELRLRYLLQPWRILPGGLLLTELGGKPWGAYEESEDRLGGLTEFGRYHNFVDRHCRPGVECRPQADRRATPRSALSPCRP